MNAGMFLEWLGGARKLTPEQRREAFRTLVLDEAENASDLAVSDVSEVGDEPTVIAATRKRVPVIAGVAATTIVDAVEQTRRYERLGKAHEHAERDGALNARAAKCDARPQHREGNRDEELADKDARHVGLHVSLGTPEFADVEGVGVLEPDLVDEIVRRAEGDECGDEGEDDAFGIHGALAGV